MKDIHHKLQGLNRFGRVNGDLPTVRRQHPSARGPEKINKMPPVVDRTEGVTIRRAGNLFALPDEIVPGPILRRIADAVFVQNVPVIKHQHVVGVKRQTINGTFILTGLPQRREEIAAVGLQLALTFHHVLKIDDDSLLGIGPY